ncbi:MAG: helix-turn-helix domain-containing protein [Phycisphaerae bacterium]|nr:helix-turn-helix domain-containing protein [Phycisphaerae bacterium]
MAKLFYTLTETSDLLGKSEDEVREMAKSGKLEEMRDGDSIMFKRQQVDLLVGDAPATDLDLDIDLSSTGSSVGMGLSDASGSGTGGDITEDIPSGGSGYGMSDSGTGLGLGGSGAGLDLGGSGFGFDLGDSGSAAGLDLGGSGAASGIGAAFEGGEDDDSAETRVADALDEELSLEAVGSGSGLLDLTNESDDTSLGAELLDEVWEDGDSGNFDANASGLFETSEHEQAATVTADSPMGLPVALAEVYDGKWSGTGVGLLLGSLIALLAVAVMLVTSIMGVSPKLATMVTGDAMIWGGGFLGFAIVAGLVGMFIGKASE